MALLQHQDMQHPPPGLNPGISYTSCGWVNRPFPRVRVSWCGWWWRAKQRRRRGERGRADWGAQVVIFIGGGEQVSFYIVEGDQVVIFIHLVALYQITPFILPVTAAAVGVVVAFVAEAVGEAMTSKK